MMRALVLAAALVGLVAGTANAQTPVQTQPSPRASANASGTIATSNTFQSVFPASKSRVFCTIQNNGSNDMWVYFGPIANATEGASVVLASGQAVYCGVNGVTLSDQVSITGTSGDAFYAAGN